MKQLSQKLSQKIKFRASLKTAETSLPQYFYLARVIATNTRAGIKTGETCGVAEEYVLICGLFPDPTVLTLFAIEAFPPQSWK